MKTQCNILNTLFVSIILILSGCEKEKGKAYVRAINDAVSVPYTAYEIDAGKGGSIHHPSGSTIEIPANSLVDSDGNPIQGPVQVQYREFMSTEAILGSGIPMRLKKGDFNQYLISSGMMEIQASQKGKPLQIKKGASVSVNLVNTVSEPGYNVYYLDTTHQEWVETVKELRPTLVKKSKNISAKVRADVEKEALKKGYVVPVKPEKAKKNLHTFEFKLYLKGSPEISVYDGVKFQFVGKKKSEDPEYNPWVKDSLWDAMHLVKTSKKGIYKLYLKRTDSINFETTVKPVFDPRDMKYAIDVYKDRKRMYEKYVAKRMKELSDAIDMQQKVDQSLDKIYRSFNIDRFGLWNTDRLEKLQNTVPMQLTLKHKNNKIKFRQAYLVKRNDTGIIDLQIQSNMIPTFNYPLDYETKMLLVDNSGKCYILEKPTLDALSTEGKEAIYTITQEGKEVKSHLDIKKMIG